MLNNHFKLSYVVTNTVVVLFAIHAVGADWPQFHGPNRDNRSSETGLLKVWPAGGPELVWRADRIGSGYASVAIVEGRIYTTGDIEKENVITALDLSGNVIWQQKNGPAYRRSHPGTRSTPTVAAGKLYNLSGNGNLICIDAKTGSPIWTLNNLKTFNGRTIPWGLSESPLIDGNKLICFPGGEKIGMVALDKDTGKTLWTCTGIGDKPGYATATIFEYQGLRQVVTLTAESAIGVALETGTLLWKYPQKVRFDANCDTPLYHDGHLFLFGTWGRGATKLKLLVEGKNCSVQELWRTPELDNEHGGVALIDGYLYGQADGDHKRRHLACLDARTGKTMWTAKELAGSRSATQTFAEGLLYLVSDRGEVALVRPNPRRLEIISQFELSKNGEGPVYARPVICGGRLYIRHDAFLYAYNIHAK